MTKIIHTDKDINIKLENNEELSIIEDQDKLIITIKKIDI